MAAIEVRGLKKSYGEVHALGGLDLTIERTGQRIDREVGRLEPY